jgi:hypothetical protein
MRLGKQDEKTSYPDCRATHTRQRTLFVQVFGLTMHERVRREIAAHSLERTQIIVLDALLKLRQVCCDPRLVKA